MAVITFMALYSVLFFVTLYLQRVHGYSATGTGVRLLALTGVMGLSAFAGSKAVAKFGPPLPLLVGALLSAGGLLGLSHLGPDTSFNAIWPYLALIGLGCGPAQTGISRAIVGGAPARYGGIAGGLQSTAVQTGGMLGLSILGSVIVSRVVSALPHKLTRPASPRNSPVSCKARRAPSRKASSPYPTTSRQAPRTRSPQAHSSPSRPAWTPRCGSRPQSSPSPDSAFLACEISARRSPLLAVPTNSPHEDIAEPTR